MKLKEMSFDENKFDFINSQLVAVVLCLDINLLILNLLRGIKGGSPSGILV